MWITGLLVLAGVAMGLAIHAILLRNKVSSAKEKARMIVEAAQAETDTIRKQALLEAKDIPIVKFGTTQEVAILLLEKMGKKGK